jgi:undecaprenyl-diphosphatase
MDLFQAFILGIVQGATEYIPVSSSAHLVLVPWLLGWPDASFAFEVLVQWGTLVVIFIFFWKDLVQIIKHVVHGLLQRQPLATFEARLGWMIVVATIPSVVLGFLFKDYFEIAYTSPGVAGVLLIVNAVLLTTAERFSRRTRTLEAYTWLDALVVGFWQVAAMLPGISRSGATISGAMFRGFDRTAAARFSFLMSIPALLGAGVLTLFDLIGTGALFDELPAITVGFIAAAISGYFCIRWLLHYLQRHSLYVFALYCLAVSALCLIVLVVRG